MSRIGNDSYNSSDAAASDPLLGTNIQYIAGKYDGGENNDDRPAPKGNTWLSSSSIIVAQMLGAGVLGLPGATKQMGWLGAVAVLVLITMFSIYGGLLLGWLRNGDKKIATYGQLADTVAAKAGHGTAWKWFVTVIGNIYILGSCTIYLVTCKLSLMQLFQKPPANGDAASADCTNTGSTKHGIADLSSTAWLLIAAAILYPLIHIRSLSEAGIVSYIGVATIAVVNVVIIAHALQSVSHETAPTDVLPSTFLNFVNGLTSLTFAYGGHVLMVDIQSVMAKPQDWPKAVWSSQLFMFANYAIVGFLGYAVYGTGVKAPITLNLPDNTLRLVTNGCLFIHVAVAYCINSTVLVTGIVEAIWPFALSSASNKEKALKWGLAASGVLGCAVGIGLVVPFFSDLMNVYSSIGIFSLSFAVPVLLWMLVQRNTMSPASRMLHAVLVTLAVTGCGLGVWGAVKDIMNKWSECHYHL
eukprot:TRINITY_DN8717_c0_g1_i1.p1 TRINITY_DN8717_c0_g1~~TRINITY_DN8717_c0_g1_i1.p1  ORF type:complete len:470 (+),score=101.85 TRINITY_DN8717_c0_g1_i1:126-1535(+)